MRKILLLIALFAVNQSASAQKVPYNVVFDVTTSDTVVHQMVVRWINEITKMDPDANIEVVFYGKSLGMIQKEKSVVGEQVAKMASQKNIAFKVCEVALKNNQIDKDKLIAGVQSIPDGIYEIISRQHEGWGYIKASR